MEEEDEDFYAPEEHTLLPSTLATASRESQGGGQNDGLSKSSTDQKMAEDLEEGEEEEEEEEEEEADESDSVCLRFTRTSIFTLTVVTGH